MRTDLIKILATIIAMIIGFVVFAVLPGLALILFLSTLVGIFVWIFMGKVYTSSGSIRLLLWIRGLQSGYSDDVDPRDLENLEKGYFILDTKAAAATPRHRFFAHLKECFERPWIPILFLISLGMNLMKFAEYIPSLIGGMTREEALQLLINVNTIIFFVSPIILGFIMPALMLLRDSNFFYFSRLGHTLDIEKSSGFGQKLLEGFVGGSALLGFIKFLIDLATSPTDLSGQIALIFLIAIGASAHSIVWTLFFYLKLHRKYVHKLNTKLERMGLPRAVVAIKRVEEKGAPMIREGVLPTSTEE